MSVVNDLTEINTAINAIESGAQEYRIGSRSLRRGDLKTLYEERRQLKAELAAENGNSIVVAQFSGR